jgi:hypothetical protein
LGGVFEGFKGGIKAGEVKTLTWHLYAEARRRRVTRSGEERRRRGRKGMDLTCGPHMLMREEREDESGEGRNPKGKAYSTEYAKGMRTAWDGEGDNGVRGGAGWCRKNWAGSQGKIQMELIFEFQMNLEFCKTLNNFTRRFRRNLDTAIFPKFF